MNFPSELFSTEKCLCCKIKKFWEKWFQFAAQKINTAAASPPSWKILIAFSPAAFPRNRGGKSLPALPHQRQATQCVKGYPRRPNLCQPSKWALDILKHSYCNSPPTELWKQLFFFLWKIPRFYFSSLSKTDYFPNYWHFSRKFHFPEDKFQIPDHEICPKQPRFLFSACAFTTLCIFRFMPIIFS